MCQSPPGLPKKIAIKSISTTHGTRLTMDFGEPEGKEKEGAPMRWYFALRSREKNRETRGGDVKFG